MNYTETISRIKSGEKLTIQRSKILNKNVEKTSDFNLIEKDNLNIEKLKEILNLYRNFTLTFTATETHIIINYNENT